MLVSRKMSTLLMLINKLATCWETLAEVMLLALGITFPSSLTTKRLLAKVLLLNVVGPHFKTSPRIILTSWTGL